MLVFLADWITKRLAVEHLSPAHVPHEVAGEYLRFTLAYNPNAAMGISLGSFSRVGFTIFAIAVLAILGTIYHKLSVNERGQAAALALIAAGALGNLTDRLKSSLGVVDFIDVGIGDTRFWTFNVADAAVSMGAVLLIVLSRRETPKAYSNSG